MGQLSCKKGEGVQHESCSVCCGRMVRLRRGAAFLMFSMGANKIKTLSQLPNKVYIPEIKYHCCCFNMRMTKHGWAVRHKPAGFSTILSQFMDISNVCSTSCWVQNIHYKENINQFTLSYWVSQPYRLCVWYKQNNQVHLQLSQK